MRNSQGIFISSTFLDMQSERDIIRDRIVPEFCEQTQTYGLHVEAIDLRWGINTDEIGEREAGVKILQTCFDEIRRTQPFFILLIGDRYGWIPEEDGVIAALRDSDQLDLDVKGKSVTEMEFAYALKTYTSMSRCFFYFREPVDFGTDEEARRKYVSDNREQLERFKDSIRKHFPEQVRSYTAAWDPDAKQFTGLAAFEEMVKRDVGTELSGMLSELSAPKNWAEELFNVQKIFIEDTTASFSGRTDEIEAAQAFLDGPTNVLVLKGNSGSGKSALMAKLSEEVQAEGRLVIPFFIGAHAKSVSAENMMAYFSYRLLLEEEGAVEDGFFDRSPEEMYKTLYATLAKVSERKQVVFLIDALDQFARSAYEKNFKWLNAFALPANVKIVMSTTDDYYQVKYLDTLDRVRLDLDYFEEEDIKEVTVRYFGTHHKEVPAPVVRALVDKRTKENVCSANPIYLLTILQELNTLDSSDFAQIERYKAQGYAPNDAIVKHLSEIVASAPVTMEALLDELVGKAGGKLGAKPLDVYLTLIANSVGGVPESFVEKVCRRLTVPFDSASFSYFRKLFGTQLALKENGQWDFNHGLIKAFYARRTKGELPKDAICSAAADVLLEEDATAFTRSNLPHFLALTHRMSALVGFWRKDFTDEEIKDAVVRELQGGVTQMDDILKGAGDSLPQVTDVFLSLLTNDRFSDEQSEYVVCRLLNALYEDKERFSAPYDTVCALYLALGDIATEYGYYSYAIDCYALVIRTAKKMGCTARLAEVYPKMENAQRLNGSLFIRRTFRRHQDFLLNGEETAASTADAFMLSVRAKRGGKEVRERYLAARAAAEREEAKISLLSDYLMTLSSDKQVRLAAEDIREAQRFVAEREDVSSARLSYALWRCLSVTDAHVAAEHLRAALRMIRGNSDDDSVETLDLYNHILQDAFCYAYMHGGEEAGALLKERATVLRQLQFIRADYRLADETVGLYRDIKKVRPADYDREVHKQYKKDRRKLLSGQRDPESIASDKLFALTCFVVAGLYFILAPLLFLSFGTYFSFVFGMKYDLLSANVISAICQTTIISCTLFSLYGWITALSRETNYLMKRKWTIRAALFDVVAIVVLFVYIKLLPALFSQDTTEKILSQMSYTAMFFTQFAFIMFTLNETVVFFTRERYKRGNYVHNCNAFVRGLPDKMIDFALRGAILGGNELLFILLKKGMDTYLESIFLLPPLWHYIIAGVLGGFMLVRIVRLFIIRRYVKKHG